MIYSNKYRANSYKFCQIIKVFKIIIYPTIKDKLVIISHYYYYIINTVGTTYKVILCNTWTLLYTLYYVLI